MYIYIYIVGHLVCLKLNLIIRIKFLELFYPYYLLYIDINNDIASLTPLYCINWCVSFTQFFANTELIDATWKDKSQHQYAASYKGNCWEKGILIYAIYIYKYIYSYIIWYISLVAIGGLGQDLRCSVDYLVANPITVYDTILG